MLKVRNLFIPANDADACRKSAAERAQDDIVAAFDASRAVDLVDGDRQAARRRVAVFGDVADVFRFVDTEFFLC